GLEQQFPGALPRDHPPARRAPQHAHPSPGGEGKAMSSAAHLLEVDRVSKHFGNVIALKDVSAHVNAGEVLCILGDNGAGKSTLIKILSGVHAPDESRVLVEGAAMTFHSPCETRALGISTVYQDLAVVPLMSIWRNFFLAAE